MGADSENTARYKLTFPEQRLGDPIIHKLSHDFSVVPTILRGRITEKDAWLEVELVGAGDQIDGAIRYLNELGVSIQRIEG